MIIWYWCWSSTSYGHDYDESYDDDVWRSLLGLTYLPYMDYMMHIWHYHNSDNDGHD